VRSYRSWPRRAAIAGRCDRSAGGRRLQQAGSPIPRVPSGNFFADSEAHTDAALRLTLDMYGLDSMLFGVAFRWEQRPPRIECLRENTTDEEVEQILDRNIAHWHQPAGLARVRKSRDVTCAMGPPMVNGRRAADPHPTRSSTR
jgi:hypothetical protein